MPEWRPFGPRVPTLGEKHCGFVDLRGEKSLRLFFLCSGFSICVISRKCQHFSNYYCRHFMHEKAEAWMNYICQVTQQVSGRARTQTRVWWVPKPCPLPSAPAGLEALARGGAAEASGRGSLWFQDGFLRETGQRGGCSLPRGKRID